MIKFLFFDYRDVEAADGFARELQQPVKYAANPMFTADKPWENGNLQFYGSVIKVPGKPFQCWYSFVHAPFTIYLAYAESEDGIHWNKPLFDIWEYEGQKTNVVLACNPHGSAIIYDEADPRPDWRYKLMCGADPSQSICAFRSSDGIHWTQVRRYPVIGTHPDCPMAFFRTPDGRFAAFHRLSGYGRTVFRSESWDFIYWSGEPRMIMEPDSGDPPQIQFYGMGAASYGPYEIGTLWMYHTDPSDPGWGKMNGYQEAEFTYSRNGYAWHRAAQGIPFIPHGEMGSWEQGNLQCASQPVYLEDEIRYYYLATTMFHQTRWELQPQTAGLGMASIKPDRFIALTAGDQPGKIETCLFTLSAPSLYINARTDADGWVKVELADGERNAIPGFAEADCIPLTGDGTALPVRWKTSGAWPMDQRVRVKVTAKNASIYSIICATADELPTYWEFKDRGDK